MTRVYSPGEDTGQDLHGPTEVVRGVRKPSMKVHSSLSIRQHSGTSSLFSAPDTEMRGHRHLLVLVVSAWLEAEVFGKLHGVMPPSFCTC